MPFPPNNPLPVECLELHMNMPPGQLILVMQMSEVEVMLAKIPNLCFVEYDHVNLVNFVCLEVNF